MMMFRRSKHADDAGQKHDAAQDQDNRKEDSHDHRFVTAHLRQHVFLGQDDRADHRHEQNQGGHLEGKQIGGIQDVTDRLGIAGCPDRGFCAGCHDRGRPAASSP